MPLSTIIALDYFNYLCIFFQVTEKLCERAVVRESRKDAFMNLANRVEEFSLRLLDFLNLKMGLRIMFFDNSETDVLMDTAIKLKMKKVILQDSFAK